MSDTLRVDPLPAPAAGAVPDGAATCPLISRRRFMQGMAAGAVALAASAAEFSPVAASSDVADPDAMGMLIDLTRCTGCNSCTLACKQANNLAHPTEIATQTDSDAYCFVQERAGFDNQGNDFTIYVKRQCMHCVHPACVSACTVGALRKTAAGPVVYDGSKCIGCRYCQYACPYGIPAYEWENPLGLISKCTMCATRVTEGEKPACASACPNGAIRYGKRSNLLAEAHGRIQSNPGRYVNHIYGEHEAGGTSMVYLAPVPFSALGFPTLGDEAITSHGEAVMRKTPVVALTVAALAAAFQYMTGRRAAHAHTEFVPVVPADANHEGQGHA